MMMKYREFLKLLESNGFYAHRTTGKHLVYRHPNLERDLPITKAKTVSSGLVRQANKLLAQL